MIFWFGRTLESLVRAGQLNSPKVTRAVAPASSHQATAVVGNTDRRVTEPKRRSTSQRVPRDDGELGAAACFTFWTQPVILQTAPEAALWNPSSPVRAWKTLRRVCGQETAGIATRVLVGGGQLSAAGRQIAVGIWRDTGKGHVMLHLPRGLRYPGQAGTEG